MERVEVELYTDGGNDAVVRMPFEGEARGIAESLLENLDAILHRYVDALERHGLRRPF